MGCFQSCKGSVGNRRRRFAIRRGSNAGTCKRDGISNRCTNDGFAQYFSGRSFLAPISTSQVGIFNVTFEPGCRNNWHIHHAKSGGGQILVCVAGRGYYQEEGKEAVEMKPGDCINIPAEVKHWHGAAPDEWFSHLAIEVPGVDCSNEWCEAVSEKEYAGLR